MILFKLPLLTCGFYVALTVLLEAALRMAARFKGIGLRFGGEHWFWTLGARFGAFLRAIWVVAFIAAWCVVYARVKAQLPNASWEAYLF